MLLAGPAGPSVPPAPAGASMGTYRLVGELDESSGRSTRPLLSFFGQLLTGPSARVWDGGTNAPWTIRLDAGWADRGDNRLAFATHVQVHAFDGSMATMYLFGLAAGSRVQTGPLALHAGAYILGGAGAVPEHANDENRATLLTGALLGLGLPLERALELVVRGDAGLLLRQRSDANLLFTISLGLEWHA
ncbi:MAG: hypothetical protein IT378_16365 [Sandaracinaceae bacterium]|nr:hypothetical protein [Sandaracinaceae bacterium]